ncbi:MAG: hypothetical protein QF565_12275, partial [Arenicellales bacterium]|nr:hypothetical protein [Arenicellales bacterium]
MYYDNWATRPIVGGWYRQQVATENLAKRGHASWRLARIGPTWLVDRLPDRFARLFDRVEWVKLGGSATDVDLAECGKLSQVRELISPDTQVTDAGLEHLKGLSQVQAIALSNTPVTGAGLAHLSGLSQLQALFLRDTQ